jgi:hypothetical protein
MKLVRIKKTTNQVKSTLVHIVHLVLLVRYSLLGNKHDFQLEIDRVDDYSMMTKNYHQLHLVLEYENCRLLENRNQLEKKSIEFSLLR